MNKINKKAIFDFGKVLVSNIFSLLSGVLIGFVVPIIMGINDYSYYKTFSLYATYVGLFHFGIADGIYLMLSGKQTDEVDKKKIHTVLISLIVLEGIITLIGIAISLCCGALENYKVIYLLVSCYLFVVNIENFYTLISQATKRFTLSSTLSLVRSILNCVLILILYISYKINDNSLISYKLFCICYVAIFAINDIIYSFIYRKTIFTKGLALNEAKALIGKCIKIGLPLMIANLTTQLIMTIDRQVISIFYPIEESNIFAYYSFAYNMLSLITVCTNAISVVLFPYMNGKKSEDLIKNYHNITTLLIIFISLAYSSYFVLSWIIRVFLPKYLESLPILKIILPGLMLNACVTVVMHNYYKALDLEKKYFIQNFIVLLLAIAFDLLAYYFIVLPYYPNNPIAISIVSVVVLFIWFVIAEFYLWKKFKIIHWKNDIFILLVCVIFYVIANIFSEWIGFAIYLGIMILLIVSFFYKKIISYISLKKNKELKNE